MVLLASGELKSHRSLSAVLCLILLVLTNSVHGIYTDESEQEGAICRVGAAAEAIAMLHDRSLQREQCILWHCCVCCTDAINLTHCSSTDTCT